jgi:hypothetical protein
MLMRGDKQHDIAAMFGVNAGRIAEIATGAKFDHVPAAGEKYLPPRGARSAELLIELLHTLVIRHGMTRAMVMLTALTTMEKIGWTE